MLPITTGLRTTACAMLRAMCRNTPLLRFLAGMLTGLAVAPPFLWLAGRLPVAVARNVLAGFWGVLMVMALLLVASWAWERWGDWLR